MGSNEWAVILVFLGTIFPAVIIWQIFATARARMSVAREEAYRKLAEENAEAQGKTAALLEQATVDLADLRKRMVEMERILKEVG